MPGSTESKIAFLTVVSAVLSLVSIAASQTLFAAACLLWIIRRPPNVRWPSHLIPLAAYMVTSVISLAMSPDPSVGIGSVFRKFFLFAMGLLAANAVTSAWRARRAQQALLAVAGAMSFYAIVQFLIAYMRFLDTQLLADDPMVLARITGSMGHWMTFSGEQMLVWCSAVPAILMLGQQWLAPLALVGAAIILSFTRSVWLGAAAGFVAVALTLPRRLLIAVLAPLMLVAILASGLIYHRISISFEQPNFAPDQSRLAYLDVGIQMIRANPFFGVGPERIRTEFPHYYRGTQLPDYYGHLHNNFMQIAAERGLLCFAAFVWFILELYRGLIQTAKAADSGTRWIALSALSALTGFLVAGLFEYNFGDSEVLLLLLFIVSMPFGIQAPHERGGTGRL